MQLGPSSHVVHPRREACLAPLLKRSVVARERLNGSYAGDFEAKISRGVFDLRDEIPHEEQAIDLQRKVSINREGSAWQCNEDSIRIFREALRSVSRFWLAVCLRCLHIEVWG